MLLVDLLFALVIAVVLFILFGSTLTGVGRPGRTGPKALMFFLILFFVIWAGGLWLIPFGPTLFGVGWGRFLAAGLVVVLILAASRPLGHHTPSDEPVSRERALRTEAVVFGWAFWLLLAFMLLGLALRYLGR
ncbi:MAG: hypothetical protein R2748_05980 [Bryobacterales bacterium]